MKRGGGEESIGREEEERAVKRERRAGSEVAERIFYFSK